ncbi:hypothetical protein GO308_09735 [Sphingomonas sp. SFZ2018-12]|uniref:hypothetical protein n=1 Tax=Sphingomonas sp. SFZ2018-12 TaxID=2683197 RepID=UPI001F115653|nr:hypothetical protein [Sphingomonas sp. SFZ2018-12]MCH4893389.1 hypothetical protein [Sphingomonas sp. SFZ2018-12]
MRTSGNGGGASARALARLGVPAIAATTPWLFAATGLEANQHLGIYTTSAAQEYGASIRSAWSPDYPVNAYRFYFSNWTIRGNAGALTQEVDGNQPIVIEGAALLVGSDRRQLTFNGQVGVTLAPGAGVWSDPVDLLVTPRRRLQIITAWRAVVGSAAMLGSFFPVPANGDAWTLGNTSRAAFLTGGIIPNNAPADLYAYGPNAAVAQGGDGRDVVLVLGDSIAAGTGEANNTADARNNRGWVARWLDSTADGARRVPYAKLAAPSAANRQNTLATHFARRGEMMAALPNLPFTRIINQMGLNDGTGSLTTWRDRVTVSNNLAKAIWPVPLLQLGFTPYTTTDVSRFTTTAGQTFVTSHDWPGGFTQQTQNALAGLPSGVDAFEFIGHFFDGRETLGAAAEGKWRADFSTINTTLQAATTVNAGSIVVRGPVPIGAAIAINAGQADAFLTTVTGVSGVGNVTCTVFPVIPTIIASGAPVRGVGVIDGLHPSSELAAWVAARAAVRKAALFV